MQTVIVLSLGAALCIFLFISFLNLFFEFKIYIRHRKCVTNVSSIEMEKICYFKLTQEIPRFEEKISTRGHDNYGIQVTTSCRVYFSIKIILENTKEIPVRLVLFLVDYAPSEKALARIKNILENGEIAKEELISKIISDEVTVLISKKINVAVISIK